MYFFRHGGPLLYALLCLFCAFVIVCSAYNVVHFIWCFLLLINIFGVYFFICGAHFVIYGAIFVQCFCHTYAELSFFSGIESCFQLYWRMETRLQTKIAQTGLSTSCQNWYPFTVYVLFLDRKRHYSMSSFRVLPIRIRHTFNDHDQHSYKVCSIYCPTCLQCTCMIEASASLSKGFF